MSSDSSCRLDPANPTLALHAQALRAAFGADGLTIGALSAPEAKDARHRVFQGEITLNGAVRPCRLYVEGANAADPTDHPTGFCVVVVGLGSVPVGAVLGLLGESAVLDDCTWVFSSGWNRFGSGGPVARPCPTGVSLVGVATGLAMPANPAGNTLWAPPVGVTQVVLSRVGRGAHARLRADWWSPTSAPIEVGGLSLTRSWTGLRTAGGNAPTPLVGIQVRQAGGTLPAEVAVATLIDGARGTGFQLSDGSQLHTHDVLAAGTSLLPPGWDTALAAAIPGGSPLSVAGELYALAYLPGIGGRVRFALHPDQAKGWQLVDGIEVNNLILGVTTGWKPPEGADDSSDGEGDPSPAPAGGPVFDVVGQATLHGETFRVHWDGRQRSLSGELQSPKDANLGTLLASAFGADVALPFGLDTLSLQTVSVWHGFSSGATRLEVLVDGKVELIPGIFELDQVAFVVLTHPVLGVRPGLSASFKLGGLQFRVGALPEDEGGWRIEADLARQGGVDVNAVIDGLLAHMGMSLPSSLPTLEIDELGFAYETASRSLTIPARLALGGTAWAITVRRGGGGGWWFSADCAGPLSIHPSELLAHLHNLLPGAGASGAAPDLRSILPASWSLTLLGVHMVFDTTNRSGSVGLEIQFGSNADVKVVGQLAAEGAGLGWSFGLEVDLTLAPLRLSDLLADLGIVAAAHASASGVLDAQLDWISLQHNSLDHSLQVSVHGSATVEGASARIDLDLKRAGGEFSVSGRALQHGAVMSLALARQADGSSLLVASFVAGGSGALSLRDLLSAHGGGLDLTVSSALLARSSAAGGGKLIAANLGVELGNDALRKIPVLGERLGPEASFGLSLHALYSDHADSILPNVVPLLPPGITPPRPPIPEGLGGSRVDVRVGTQTYPLDGFVPKLQDSGVPSTPAGTPPPTPVNASLGGVVGLRSIRPSVKGSALHLTVDGAVKFGPLTLDAIGLDLGWDFKASVPTVPSLDGFSVALDKPPLAVAGAFLHVDDDFVGKAEIRTSKFSLTALGGFAMVGGSPSLFLYGLLLDPLGGPPFFFVEGLAAGFGLNRKLRTPTLDEVETFPLVVDAMSPPGGVLGGDQMRRLHDYIAPQVGAGFLAVGVKFTSFRLVHGFLLAMVAIDTITGDFEVAVVGTGEWISPPEAPVGARMAYVRLDILAKMSSRDSSLIVEAKLGDGCFVINPLCHISGGMALGTWFAGKHAGDFVLSIGGYHPAFVPPAHYPVPKRLTLDYHIAAGLHASGSVYFALTPNNLMFGFAFHATWSTGPVSAWFDLALDFLMKFKPVHYDATGHLEIGASVDLWLGSISVSAGADLHIWGPDFGGHACVHLGPFHGDVSFGADVTPPPALSATAFVKAFLPSSAEDVLSIQPAGGLRSAPPDSSGKPARWVFNPKELAIEVRSLVPLDTALTIPPMCDATVTTTAQHALVITLDKVLGTTTSPHDLSDLVPTGLSRRFPPALWKAAGGGAPDQQQGVRLSAKRIVSTSDKPYTRSALSKSGAAPRTIRAPAAWATAVHAARTASDRGADRDSYVADLAAPQPARDAMLSRLAALLDDLELRPDRSSWRVDAVALLDPPLPSPPP